VFIEVRVDPLTREARGVARGGRVVIVHELDPFVNPIGVRHRRDRHHRRRRRDRQRGLSRDRHRRARLPITLDKLL